MSQQKIAPNIVYPCEVNKQYLGKRAINIICITSKLKTINLVITRNIINKLLKGKHNE